MKNYHLDDCALHFHNQPVSLYVWLFHPEFNAFAEAQILSAVYWLQESCELSPSILVPLELPALYPWLFAYTRLSLRSELHTRLVHPDNLWWQDSLWWIFAELFFLIEHYVAHLVQSTLPESMVHCFPLFSYWSWVYIQSVQMLYFGHQDRFDCSVWQYNLSVPIRPNS